MPETGVVFLLGTAGSGKTVLSAVLRRYLIEQEVNVINVNLDPAVQKIPYTCEVDIREYLDIQEIIDKYELGPNAAMITAADLVATEIQTIKEDIDDYSADAILIDTPGQLEVFVYRNSGPLIVQEFNMEATVSLFLMDANLVRSPSSWVSLNLLAVSTQFRLGTPMMYALSKADLLNEEEIDNLERWNDDIDLVTSDFPKQEASTTFSLSMNLIDAIRDIQANVPLIPVSALNETGLEDISGNLSRIWQKGDDWKI
ncbi:MAG: ATP/GTP-binding protein [Candidatus Hodarchaeales archaeon]